MGDLMRGRFRKAARCFVHPEDSRFLTVCNGLDDRGQIGVKFKAIGQGMRVWDPVFVTKG
jgi:hypothetical protein